MKTIAQCAPLLVLPAFAIGAGCFSSSSTTSTSFEGGLPDGSIPEGSSSDVGAPPPVDAAVDHAAPPIAAGGTGAFGIVTVGGKQKMYLPQRNTGFDGNAVITVVDVGLAGNGVSGAPAQVNVIDLQSPDVATATGGDSSVVVAVSTIYSNIYFIDPTTDTLTKTITLDQTYGQSGFSGGGGYVTGVAIDSANHRAILSVWNGFAIVDLTSQSITSVIQAPPSENFGFDSVNQRILAPFYDCVDSTLPDGGGGFATPSSCNTPLNPEGGVITAGLDVIDLKDNTVYTYENPNPPAQGINGVFVDPTAPVGQEPDSAAADPTTGVVVVPAEGGGFQNVIDFSKATFDKASKTVTAPQNIIPNLALTGVAVEPTRHLAFFEGEGSDQVAVTDLTQANAGGTASVTGSMPLLPGDAGTPFSNIGDPHGIAVTTGITGGGPVGFVVDTDLRWVARVDLAMMVATEQADAASILTAAQMAPFVTFLDAYRHE
jgi:hypothetical protein